MPVPQIQGLEAPNYAGSYNRDRRRDSIQRVFVYGTLKKGFGNHEYHLKECKFLGEASLQGIMFHLGGFPAINLAEKFSRIVGEVYEVNWDHVVDMDQLEGVDRNFYSRVETLVSPFGVVWTYVFEREQASRQKMVVPSGIWRGPDTPKVEWKGFGKGISIGSFETNNDTSEVKVGAGNSAFVLQRKGLDGQYYIVNKTTGESLGPYRYLRDRIATDGLQRPVLGLPKKDRMASVVCVRCGKDSCEHLKVPSMVAKVDAAIKETLTVDGKVLQSGSPSITAKYIPPNYEPAPKQQTLPNVPVVWTPEVLNKIQQEFEEENIPQSARLLGYKYGAA